MSRLSTSRLLVRSLHQTFSKPQFTTPSVPQWTRLVSQSARREAFQPPASKSSHPMEQLARSAMNGSSAGGNQGLFNMDIGEQLKVEEEAEEEPHHFHIYSHRHNTHITVTKPNRDAIISMSTGQLGFKKAGRKSYDAAYQLGAYVVDKLHQMGVVNQIHKLEVVLRGFGQGRDAVVKVLMGNQGKMLRGKIIRVADSTRLKIGGTRAPNPRRLG